MPQKDARSLYHRWRSQSFSEVIAQDHVTRTLRNAIATGRVVHAYLFCGPRGTGKTSTARILAKAVNCLDPRDGEPCNECASCTAVTEGRAIDLIEIDAASNRGIDDARELREKIKFAPGEARYKVYIIDEAHMLTSEASNALLKTLEEPPEHAIIILATTESHKILATISSRCQRFDFRRIPVESIVEQLQMICDAESLRVEPAVLERVARMARGSLRDAESLLDQLVAYCGEEVGLSAAREILGLTGEESVPEFAEALRRRDLARGFLLIDGASSTGSDLRHLSRELVDYLRALMVSKSGADTSLLQGYRAEELARLRAEGEGWSYRSLLNALRVFADLEGRLRQEAFNQLHLEMAFMEAILQRDEPAEPTEVRRISEDRPTLASQPASLEVQPPVRQAVERSPEVLSPAPVDVSQPTIQREPSSSREESALDAAPESPRGYPPLDLDSVKREWPRILVGFTKTGIGIAVARCRPLRVVDDTLVLGFESTGSRHVLERPTVKKSIEDGVGGVFGKRITVRFEYGVRPGDNAPPRRDPVVEAAVRDFGFRVSREETIS